MNADRPKDDEPTIRDNAASASDAANASNAGNASNSAGRSVDADAVHDADAARDADLDALLRMADPGANPIDPQAVARLAASWRKLSGQPDVDQQSGIDAPVATAIPVGRWWRQHHVVAWVVAATLLVACTIGWLRSLGIREGGIDRVAVDSQIDNPTGVATRITTAERSPDAEPSDSTPPRDPRERSNDINQTPEKSADRTNPSISGKPSATEPKLAGEPKSAGETAAQPSTTIRSVAQLIDAAKRPGRRGRPISLAARTGREIDLDQDALRREMEDWLVAWDSAAPDDRQELRKTWVANRAYWLPWTISAAGSWDRIEANRASIAVVVDAEGPAAEPFLWNCLNSPPLAHHAWGALCRMLPDSRLDRLANRVTSCDQLQMLVATLSGRESPEATRLLTTLCQHADCRSIISALRTDWSPSHAKRCVTMLASASESERFAAACLLATIPTSDIDNWLGTAISGNTNRIDIASILLMRETIAAKKILAAARGQMQIAPNLPSAVQQVSRWRQTVDHSSSLFNKVCMQCDESA
jgi:hypothetical protein